MVVPAVGNVIAVAIIVYAVVADSIIAVYFVVPRWILLLVYSVL